MDAALSFPVNSPEDSNRVDTRCQFSPSLLFQCPSLIFTMIGSSNRSAVKSWYALLYLNARPPSNPYLLSSVPGSPFSITGPSCTLMTSNLYFETWPWLRTGNTKYANGSIANKILLTGMCFYEFNDFSCQITLQAPARDNDLHLHPQGKDSYQKSKRRPIIMSNKKKNPNVGVLF